MYAAAALPFQTKRPRSVHVDPASPTANGAAGSLVERFVLGSKVKPDLPPRVSRRVPVHAVTATPDRAGTSMRRQRFVAGSNAKPPRFPPPTTRTSLPSQTASAPVRPSGNGGSRRHEFRAGSYAAARASLAGHGLPSGSRSPTRITSSRPVHAPTGDWLPASGETGSLRQRFVAGLKAAPSENASPQQPPPQPT